jgi:hypothetical protein
VLVFSAGLADIIEEVSCEKEWFRITYNESILIGTSDIHCNFFVLLMK